MSHPISTELFEKIHEITDKHPEKSIAEVARQLGGIGKDAVGKWRKISKHPDELTVERLPDQIHKWLMLHMREVSIDEISDHFNVGVSKVRDALKLLKNNAKAISLISDSRISAESIIPPSTPTRLDITKFKGSEIKIGVTSDNHLGSMYYRDDILHALFDIWQEQGITDVYQGGNMIDGEAPFNKHDLLVHGLQNQVEYFVENWPERPGMTTHFVTGDDHEGWYVQREGINIGEFIQMVSEKNGRKDLDYMGHMEHDIIYNAKHGKASMRVMHAGMGSSYAISYSVQKIVESYTGGEKPSIMLVGHFHKAEYSYIRNVHVVQMSCTEDQTPFMRKRRLQAHLGGWTVSFTVDDWGNIHNFTPQFHPFYDKEFYDRNWQYRHKSAAKRGKK